jgi:hypothetical protein
VREHTLSDRVLVVAEHGDEIRPPAVVPERQKPIGAREIAATVVDLAQPVQRCDGDFVQSKTRDWAPSPVRCVDDAALPAVATLPPHPSGGGGRRRGAQVVVWRAVRQARDGGRGGKGG